MTPLGDTKTPPDPPPSWRRVVALSQALVRELVALTGLRRGQARRAPGRPRPAMPTDPPAAGGGPADPAGLVTASEYDRLVAAAVIDKVEMLQGRILMGRWLLALAPEQARAAKRAGVPHVRTCVDAVLEDEQARAEVAARLGLYAAAPAASHTSAAPRPKTVARQRIEEAAVHAAAANRSATRVVENLRATARALRR